MVSEGSSEQVLEQARAAVDEGVAWRARDLLVPLVEAERDPEALALLSEVYQSMGDLPRAGAVMFACGAKGPEADAAVAAWREQSGDDFAVMWWSLPASVRVEPLPRRLEALRERARAAGADVDAEGMADAKVTATASDADDLAAQVPVAKPSTEVAVRDNDGDEHEDDGGFDTSWYVAWVLAVLFVVFAVIGFVTALGWIVPG
jgi:hypothetical protein